MLDSTLKAQLASHLEKLSEDVELVATVDETPKSAELIELITEIAELSPKVSASSDGTDQRAPSFQISRANSTVSVGFAGLPMGHEFTSLVLAILQVGGHPSTLDAQLVSRIQALNVDATIETYFSWTCQICPDVIQALNTISVLNPRIKHVSIDGSLFADEVEQRQVMAIPTVFKDGQAWEQGRVATEQLVEKLESESSGKSAEERNAETVTELSAKDPFDVLIVGGGPAGSAAAVYAARKGIRTGLVAEQFGGQLLDTLGIENLISTDYTEGPKLARQLEENVKAHAVDIISGQRAAKLVTGHNGSLHRLSLESGADLQAKTLIVSTGARWRTLGVPGEAEYKNKGVAYCPHCDGPIYKGKRVAVVGGGNSGVEAAIDLAGLVEHVTLIEFDTTLRADQVLQDKLHSLPNATVVTNAATQEIVGDGSKVTQLRYEDRADQTQHSVDLEGVFVQIGLLPNTEWLEGSIELSNFKEVEIDDKGNASAVGVFAAGDCTTVPYKQIVVSMGAGSIAALSAFDYLMRN